MSTLLKPGSTTVSARIEVIDPLADPLSVDPDIVRAQVSKVREARTDAPPIDLAALERALAKGDEIETVDILGPLRFHWGRRYRVLDEGKGEVRIPFLVAAAPDIEGAKVTAAQTRSGGAGAEFSFKIAGSGLDASAKVTVDSGLALSCAPGEIQEAMVIMPVRWERRADQDNEDKNWTYVVPEASTGQSNIVVQLVPSVGKAQTLRTERIDESGGKLPGTVSRNYTIDSGFGFTVGLKIDAVGIDTSLKVSVEDELKIDLAADLPSGHRYEVAWLGDPMGVAVGADV